MSYSNYTEIEVSFDKRVATVAFNREAQLNSFSQTLKAECIDALNRLAADDSVGAIVITGKGKHFCAGANIVGLKENIDSGECIAPEVAWLTIEWVRTIRRCLKPVIAMVNGAAMGGGAAIASACDYRFMEPSGKFGMAFINMGLSCDSSSMYSLSRVVGPGKALELIMSGEINKGEAAEKLGWARLTEQGKLAETTYEFAHMLSNKPGMALARNKRMANAIFWADFETYENMEIPNVVECGKSYDHKEGVTAFLEKRAPEFRHK